MREIIKENNTLKRFGHLIAEDGKEVFFHFDAFDDPSCLLLKEKDAVEFILVEGARAHQASHIKPIK